ncbi:ATP-grasp ribosomal peptide maturase [Nonomuraea sp. NEAU-A123]|uniref:ATP-grasp ribosomal peptide maturase n=1 Tax=Nonomuraea sp. NEAU-A123 TaxID=2839649 RepID=UPI001BE4A7AE|nr:ATP-grasp ribosomal peptide maturase [Nonomuraea sp. NEAU-A123]MBT2233262.1 ATP-grasp ribosomal peptide maturase [Nonomuraea sp. NEAU-A123]
MSRTPRTVLVVTSPADETANTVIRALQERRAHVARVDPADIGAGLTFSARIGDGRDWWSGQLVTPSRKAPLEEIGAVYYRRPSPLRSDATDEQARLFAINEARHGLGGLLRNLPNGRYVNHPGATERADFKIAQLRVAARLGMRIPNTLVTNDLDAAREFALKHVQVIYKSFRSVPAAPDGRVGAIWTQRVNPDELDHSVSMTAHMFQEKIQKSSDARVTVVGRQVFATRITHPDDAVDWREGDWDDLMYGHIDVPEVIKSALYAYLGHFGLVFGCFDFALEDGEFGEAWTFMECNPNGQWAWLPDFGTIAQAFADVLLEGWWP